jgi:bifunctional DNA-binding transcriptional regulator/antitoxin component of YhaV-PrlF toxin-antitoxin module
MDLKIGKISNDAWRINIPAEMLMSLGYSKGDDIKISIDRHNERIILERPLTSDLSNDIILNQNKSVPKVNLVNRFSNTVLEKVTKPKTIKRLPKIVENKITIPKKKKEKDFCYYCDNELSQKDKCKENGHRICNDCLNLVVKKKLLLYMRGPNNE